MRDFLPLTLNVLPGHDHGKSWIGQSKIRRIHWGIQSVGERTPQMGLFWDFPWLQWIPAVRQTDYLPAPNNTGGCTLLWNSHNSRLVASQMEFNTVCAHIWRFWTWICEKARRRSLGKCSLKKIMRYPRIGRVRNLQALTWIIIMHQKIVTENVALLVKLNHPTPSKLQLTPHKCLEVKYGRKT